MNGVEWISEYQNLVVAQLAQMTWAETIGIYPDLPDAFPTPAIFVDVARWEKSDTAIGGSITLNLTCNIYLLRHFSAGAGEDETQQGGAEMRVRNAAGIISRWIDGRQFGRVTRPAVLESADPMQWQTSDSAPEYAIWCVTYTQSLAMGVDPFDPPAGAPLLKNIFVGFAPDIGAAHEEDYFGPIPQSGE
ncbi:hypothetical protein MQY53_001596 [Salmonella enterica subsp. enterica]|nr:hypothetical protein [Salmonella enterica subsp. enterica]